MISARSSIWLSGLSNDEIARSLGVSPQTIRNQLGLLCTRVAFADRSQAALPARDLGFGGVR